MLGAERVGVPENMGPNEMGLRGTDAASKGVTKSLGKILDQKNFIYVYF